MFRKFYDHAADYFQPSFIAELILLIAEYQYKANFAVDQEINTSAFLIEVAGSVQERWK